MSPKYHIVVTSTPSSVPYAAPGISSLCQQRGIDIQVYWFLPWFSEREHSVYPMHVPDWTKELPKLEVVRVQDDGPGCAVSYALDRREIMDDDFLVYAHDDMVYSPECLQTLAKAQGNTDRDVALGFRGSWFRWVPAQYSKRKAVSGPAWLNQVSYLHGSHLVVLRRGVLPKSREIWYSHLCAYPRFRYQPDGMLAAYAYRAGVPMFVVTQPAKDVIRLAESVHERASRKQYVMWFGVPLGLLPIPWFELLLASLLVVLGFALYFARRTRVSRNIHTAPLEQPGEKEQVT